MQKLELAKWMALKELNNKQLSDKSGVSEATISSIRQKKNYPTTKTLIKIASALSIKPEQIIY